MIKVLIKTRATLCSRILCNDMIWPLGMILYSVDSIQDMIMICLFHHFKEKNQLHMYS